MIGMAKRKKVAGFVMCILLGTATGEKLCHCTFIQPSNLEFILRTIEKNHGSSSTIAALVTTGFGSKIQERHLWMRLIAPTGLEQRTLVLRKPVASAA